MSAASYRCKNNKNRRRPILTTTTMRLMLMSGGVRGGVRGGGDGNNGDEGFAMMKASTTSLLLAASSSTAAATSTKTSTSTLSSSTSSSSSSSWRSRTKSWIRRRFSNKKSSSSSSSSSSSASQRTDEELKLGIAGFYDRSSKLWEDVWGEHMHHGYYVPANRTDHVQAQIDLIDQVLQWAGVVDKVENNKAANHTGVAAAATTTTTATTTIPRRVVDVGCGIGGSSRHMARLFQQIQQQQQQEEQPSDTTSSTTTTPLPPLPPTLFTGITLSPYQAQRANELAQQQGLDSVCQFQVADAMNMPFDDNTFDLVWSLESGEHMPHKEQFCQELVRVCAPGGRIVLVTWCHRDLVAHDDDEDDNNNNNNDTTTLQPWEVRLLDQINRAYYLPKWCSVQDYVAMFQQQLGATNAVVQRDDWSYIIAPFWKAVLQSAWSWKSVVGLFRSGWTTQRGAIAMLLMLRGYQRGLIKFGLITCVKPETTATTTTTTMNKNDNDDNNNNNNNGNNNNNEIKTDNDGE